MGQGLEDGTDSSAWAFLTLLSCVACFCVAWGAHQLAKFDIDRPWFDRAQAAERRTVELQDENAAHRADLRRLRESLEAVKVTLRTTQERAQFVEPRLAAAERWLDTHNKRIMSNPGFGTAEVEDKP